jgi:double-strand break repair protein MRE11
MPRFSVDNNTMRVLISTDNHLGYAERDPVRGNDSFAAFEEIMYLAQKFSVDMVLIAGDLFHENRPTRHTMHKTMEIMRRYCMGPNPVKIRMLSEPAKNFRSGTVNYLDPNYSVHLPVFSIHGNHDDPSRDAGCRDLLAALDLLSVSNLINYFGRQDEVDKVCTLLTVEYGTWRA